jgi:hypothetical protein
MYFAHYDFISLLAFRIESEKRYECHLDYFCSNIFLFFQMNHNVQSTFDNVTIDDQIDQICVQIIYSPSRVTTEFLR